MRNILITGGTGEIGNAVKQKFLEEESFFGIHSFQKKEQKSENTLPLLADFSKKDAAKSLLDQWRPHSNRIDTLIHLAGGVSNPEHWTRLSEEDWDYDLRLNLSSAWSLVKEALPFLEKSNSPRIVLVSTASVKKGGGPTSLAYGTAKAGIECITKQFARDLASKKILVNCVAPGYIDTKFHTEQMKRDKQALEKRKEFVPLKRAGTPKEVAEWIYSLGSEKNTFITGEILRIDGGDFI